MYLTYLPPAADGIGTFPLYHPDPIAIGIFRDGKEGGCQGFIGPLPSAFLDKYVKRTGAKIKVE